MRRFAADDVWGPISLREYDVLYTLVRRGGGAARLRELTDEVLLPQPSLSRLVDRLEGKGLVARRAHPGDRRGVVIAVTDAGREVQRAVGRRHAASVAGVVGASLSDDELGTLRRLCETVLSGGQSGGLAGGLVEPSSGQVDEHLA